MLLKIKKRRQKLGESALEVFLKQACPARYDEVNREIQNDFKNMFPSHLMGENNHPSNLTGAYNMFANWRQCSRPRENVLLLDDVKY